MTIFAKHDIDHILTVVKDEVEWAFDDADEIGSSDVSCCVREVIRQLGENPDTVSKQDFQMIRNAVYNNMPRD